MMIIIIIINNTFLEGFYIYSNKNLYFIVMHIKITVLKTGLIFFQLQHFLIFCLLILL